MAFNTAKKEERPSSGSPSRGIDKLMMSKEASAPLPTFGGAPAKVDGPEELKRERSTPMAGNDRPAIVISPGD